VRSVQLDSKLLRNPQLQIDTAPTYYAIPLKDENSSSSRPVTAMKEGIRGVSRMLSFVVIPGN
jgi:hypothetical protein